MSTILKALEELEQRGATTATGAAATSSPGMATRYEHLPRRRSLATPLLLAITAGSLAGMAYFALRGATTRSAPAKARQVAERPAVPPAAARPLPPPAVAPQPALAAAQAPAERPAPLPQTAGRPEPPAAPAPRERDAAPAQPAAEPPVVAAREPVAPPIVPPLAALADDPPRASAVAARATVDQAPGAPPRAIVPPAPPVRAATTGAARPEAPLRPSRRETAAPPGERRTATESTGGSEVEVTSIGYSNDLSTRTASLRIGGQPVTLHQGDSARGIEVQLIMPHVVYLRRGRDIFAVDANR